MVSGHLDLAARCLVHADKADDAGLYTTANVLWLAAQALKAEPMTPAEIRAVRRQLGLSVTQFADALSVKPQTVRRWQSGIREPSVQTVMLIERMVAERLQTGGVGL